MTDDPSSRREAPWGIAPEGHRVSADTCPGTVRLQVAELDRSLAYYRRVLGLDVLAREEGRARLGTKEGREADGTLVELREKPGAAPAPRGGRPGLYHFAILLPDRPALGRFAAHLSHIGARAGAADHGVSEALYLHDPDGLGIEVYADRPRDEWRHEGRQLLMGTDPLDVNDLVRAGGDAPWSAMPEGTRIGHVHLHVGDLARAEAFYHQALGLDKTVWSYPGALFLSAGGYHHHLGLNTWARSATPAGPGDARLLEWELRMPTEDDVRRTFESLEAAGHPVERAVAVARGGPEDTASAGGVVRDPWGTALRIIADVP